jgi:hypothetical protein
VSNPLVDEVANPANAGHGHSTTLPSSNVTTTRGALPDSRPAQIKMNSVTVPYDAVGNGQAVADREWRSWLDGVLVSEVRACAGAGIRKWHSGPLAQLVLRRQAADETHQALPHEPPVVARCYIGPRVA